MTSGFDFNYVKDFDKFLKERCKRCGVPISLS